MKTHPSMLIRLENAVIARLESLGLQVRDFDIQKGPQGLLSPAVFVAVDAGKYSRTAQQTVKCELSLYVTVVFRHLRDEKERRHGLYPILEGVVTALMMEDLGLRIAPLEPRRFRNITDNSLVKHGLMAFEIELGTSFTLSKPAEEDAADLLRIGLDYYQDKSRTAHDEIELKENT